MDLCTCVRLGSRAWASSAGLQFGRIEMVANSGTRFEQSLGTYVLRLLNSRQSFQDGTWLASWRGCNETLMEDDANALILFWDLRSAVSSVKLEDFCCGSYSLHTGKTDQTDGLLVIIIIIIIRQCQHIVHWWRTEMDVVPENIHMLNLR